MFDVPTLDVATVSVNFVGVLKDILKLDYGPVHTPTIIFKCEWVKGVDNRVNVTYVKDDYGFLTMHFRYRLPLMAKSFIFPFQVTHIFFSDDLRKLGWKVILKKKAQSRREVVDIENVFITTIMEAGGLTTPTRLPT
jgi:hypothetical protein